MSTIATTRRTRRVRTVALALAGVLLLSGCQPNRFVSGWIPYWGGNNSRAAVSDASATTLFSEASLFWYGARSDGSVGLNGTQSNLTTTVNALRAQGLPVIPTIVDGTAAGTMSGILANSTSRANHISKIVALVTSKFYDGIDIDYEVFAFSQRSIWSSIRPTWIAFVNELAAALHAKGKLLSVTVPPSWFTPRPSEPSGLYENYWVYAQADIAPAIDRLRLMVYDWSVSSPGPIAPISWVNKVIDYSTNTAKVPVSKLQLGVPAYGRHWAVKKNSTDVCPSSMIFNDAITLPEVAPLAAAHGITPTRDASGELTFSWTESSAGEQVVASTPTGYTAPGAVAPTIGASAGSVVAPAQRVNPKIPANCTVQHTVYVPDATSIRQRADAAVAADWSGIAIWALGYETQDVYTALSGVAAQRPNGASTITLDTPVVSGTTVTITGAAYDPEYDLPIVVLVEVDGTEYTRVLARTSRGGMPVGLGPFHGLSFSLTFPGHGLHGMCFVVLDWGGVATAARTCVYPTV